MRGRLQVDEQEDYLAWLEEQMTFEEMLANNGINNSNKLASKD